MTVKMMRIRTGKKMLKDMPAAATIAKAARTIPRVLKTFERV